MLSLMKPEWRKYGAAPAPRYTSYPSALYFNDGVGETELARGLEDIGLYEPLSLYLHMPYCGQLCWYCGCNARVENNYDRVTAYAESLMEECRLVGERLGGRGRVVSIHLGGGTPNILEAKDVCRLVDSVERHFGLTDDASLSLELDPRLVKRGDISGYATCGFTRLSLGVQDFDARVQQAINREQSFDLVEQCVASARGAGFADVSFDLLYGLPFQTLETFADTLDKTLALAPDRAAVFGYAHLPEVIKRQRRIDSAALPDAGARLDLALLADGRLTGAGYRRIGFDHYARPSAGLAKAAREGRLRRNFQGFTDDIAETVIGLGASAISYMNGLYAQNLKDVGDYRARISAGRLGVERGAERTERDHVYAGLIETFLCNHAIDLQSIAYNLSQEEIADVKTRVAEFIRDGVLEERYNVLHLHRDAWPFSRAVAAAIDPYLAKAANLAPAI